MSNLRGRILGVGAILIALVAGGSPAHAAEPGQVNAEKALQAGVEREMRANPGGVQTAPDEISYGGGRFVVTVTKPGQQAARTCPSGWYCFWDGYNYTGNRGRLSSCGEQALAPYGWANRIKSVYNLSPNTVRFRDYATGAWEEFPSGSYDNAYFPLIHDAADRRC
jgi:hypothetical protein